MRRALLLAASLFLSSVAVGQSLPPGFVLEPIGDGWSAPVGLVHPDPLDPTRMLVVERSGRVWWVVDGQKVNVVLDIADETLVNGDRGLLDVAVGPDFFADGWLYLLYIVDERGNDSAALAFARLMRVRTAFDASGALLAVPGTREDLLGGDWSSGIPSCHLSHTIGSLRFLSDGSLVLTSGDNAHYDFTDVGGADPACFDPGRTPPDQDLGAFRSQYDDSLAGKVLRLDPETGLGLPDNPFFSGDPSDLVSRVWARGLRNPFRFTLVPGTGPREALLISDVGWNRWEEIDLCLGGENFGWPCFEGAAVNPEYTGADPYGFCAAVAVEHAPPRIDWHHTRSGQTGFRGNCATGLEIYRGERYPEVYRGRLFFCDYGRSWMRAAALDDQLGVTNVLFFGNELGGPAELVSEPVTGDLLLTTVGNPGVFRLRYLGAGLPPTARVVASETYGPGDLLVDLSGASSSDPEDQDLAHEWDLGDGTTASGSEVTHLFTAAATVRLTVTDTEGLSATAEVRIVPHDTPPRIVALDEPRANQRFESGEPMALAVRAEDDEDVGGPEVSWKVDLVHDHHVHPDWFTALGPVAEFTPDAHGPGDNHFVVHVTARDAQGLTDTRTVEVFEREAGPHAHLEEIEDGHLRVGQRLAPVAHVDFTLGAALGKHASLTFDWGDGTQDVHLVAPHGVDFRPEHVYRAPGTYSLRLIAEHDGDRDVAVVELEVGPARPTVAVFAALEQERFVPPDEQAAILAELAAALEGRASAVLPFTVGTGEGLARWMDSVMDDDERDVLVLLDYVPAALATLPFEESPLARWIAGGNALVWTGATPFVLRLDDSGTIENTALLADTFFAATAPLVVQGGGPQTPTALAAGVLPSLPSFQSQNALRIDQLGPAWHVRRLFAVDTDEDSDAVELRHDTGGLYAQLMCVDDPGPVRAAVLREYLFDLVGDGRARRARSGPGR